MRYLIVRIGAYGDVIVTTPLIRYLHNEGHSVYVLTSEKGGEVLRHNPYIDQLIFHDTEVPNGELLNYFKKIQEEEECDKLVDLCESVETNIIFKCYQPQYNYPKEERRKLAEINMYEQAFQIAGIDPSLNDNWVPDMFFSDYESGNNNEFRARFIGKKILVWGLSGSGLHKSYPYTPAVLTRLLENNTDLVVMTVGDLACQILEIELSHPRIFHYSGEWTFRESAIMCKNAHTVISTETGIIHAAGCFNVNKIIMYSHTTHECLGKHFKNATAIHPKVPCAPCFRLIDNSPIQCPTDSVTTAPECMASGISPDRVYETLTEVLESSHAIAC